MESQHINRQGEGWICDECNRSLNHGKLPKYSLANNMWLGNPPLVLRKLTFAETLLIARHYPRCYVFKLYPKDSMRGSNPAHLQRGMAGNVTLYEVNTNAVGGMLEGQLFPQPVETLSNIIAITFIGTRCLPSNWMARTFKVRRSAVHQALQWLQANNELYRDIVISSTQLASLPEDDVPDEVNALIRHVDDETVAIQEREGYVNDEMGK